MAEDSMAFLERLGQQGGEDFLRSLAERVLAQLMDFVPKHEFDKCVQRYGGDKRVRSLSCYSQFLAMCFAQLTGRESLRDIETCLRAVAASPPMTCGCNCPSLARSAKDWTMGAWATSRLSTEPSAPGPDCMLSK